jgi:hypothetical protein
MPKRRIGEESHQFGVCPMRERERFEMKAMVQGFKYHWTRVWLDIVRAHQTLSGLARHCLDGPDFV